ncbi:MAG: methyltransferase domain-containing protein [Patescibacteria group bacterium]|nr:methyltransferase domain-containing protein [Patescibacteria group bacterium]
MTLKSFLHRFFLGSEVIEKIPSKINGEILVAKDLWGNKEMIIGRVEQSGGLVEALWKQIFNFHFSIFNEFSKSNFQCLILGLGCGTGAKLIAEKYPQAKITGIEIDQEVIKVGKKYFGLDKIPNLEIIAGDAIKWIKEWGCEVRSGSGSESEKLDLIIVDLYLGQEFPKEAETEVFLNGLKNLLTDNGWVVFNRLYFNKEHRQRADKFLIKVKEIFPLVKTKKEVTNLLIFASFGRENEV